MLRSINKSQLTCYYRVTTAVVIGKIDGHDVKCLQPISQIGQAIKVFANQEINHLQTSRRNYSVTYKNHQNLSFDSNALPKEITDVFCSYGFVIRLNEEELYIRKDDNFHVKMFFKNEGLEKVNGKDLTNLIKLFEKGISYLPFSRNRQFLQSLIEKKTDCLKAQKKSEFRQDQKNDRHPALCVDELDALVFCSIAQLIREPSSYLHLKNQKPAQKEEVKNQTIFEIESGGYHGALRLGIDHSIDDKDD